MAEKAKKETAVDVLDEIRQVEKAARRALLIKVLGHLKYVSRKILRYKELIRAELAEMGISEDDAKRIIDFINESGDVKLSEDEIKEIRQEAKDSIRDKKKSIEGEIERKAVPDKINAFYANLATSAPNEKYFNTIDNTVYTTTTGSDLTMRNDAGSELSVKL